MPVAFDIRRFLYPAESGEQYGHQLDRLADEGKSTEGIEAVVEGALKHVQTRTREKRCVIYSEPQSGKTDMMICLTARLLDEGCKHIVHLLNASPALFERNLARFHASGLPAGHNFEELLERGADLTGRQCVIFVKKREASLRSLRAKLAGVPDVIVIDEGAHCVATGADARDQDVEVTNGLISDIVGDTGFYIGLTGRPARLNLSSSFTNDSSLWVEGPPHRAYTGQDQFFPMDLYTRGLDALPYRLVLLSDQADDAVQQRDALLRFLVNVAHLNLAGGKERYFSMLVHTRRTKADYKADFIAVRTILDILGDRSHPQFAAYVEHLWRMAQASYPSVADAIARYVLQNIARSSIFVLNGEAAFRRFGRRAATPNSLFTIVMGGNIVSRGVTFNNLLSMFFPRNVKHEFKNDSYIQRARMFGSRSDYLDHFELTMPADLFFDWHRCFVYHRLALASIKAGLGSPVWLADPHLAPALSPDPDQSTLDMDRGEMSFAMFDYDQRLERALAVATTVAQRMEVLARFLPEPSFPAYLRSFILQSTGGGEAGLRILPTADVLPTMTWHEQHRIARRKGLMTVREADREPGNLHFLRMFRNPSGHARLFYKIETAQRFLGLQP